MGFLARCFVLCIVFVALRWFVCFSFCVCFCVGDYLLDCLSLYFMFLWVDSDICLSVGL